MPEPNHPDAAVTTERLLSANPSRVFAAFEQPELLAQWWGPAGFTNTFEHFDFKPKPDMLTARQMFPNRTFAETVMSHISRVPDLPSMHVPVPKDLEDVVMRCLEKKPDNRFQSVRQLDEALARCEAAAQWKSEDARSFWLSLRPSVQLKVKGAA